jgi:putative transposase
MLVYMTKRIHIFGSAFNMIGGLIGVLAWLLRFGRLMLVQKAALAAELLALHSQLVTCADAIEQKKAPKPRFTLSFRLLWIALSKWLPDWRTLAHVMQPATVVGWHRRTARFLWRWKSRPGRPTVSRKMQALIRRLSRENPLWGAEHIREELAKLNYDPPCEDSVRKYMAKPEKPRRPSSTWLPFLRNHLDVAWAMDYHIKRPHQGLGGETPVPHEAPDISGPTRLVSPPVLGGLHHTYRRVAA